MEFWKMNGAGNDFIVVDDRRNAIPENRWPEIVRVLCERHMSIGADGCATAAGRSVQTV